MSVNPEEPFKTEVLTDATLPSFIIDQDAPPDIAINIQSYLTWLVGHPSTSLLAVQNIHNGTKPVEGKSMWGNLTSPQYCKYYEFDEGTTTTFKNDGRYKKLDSMSVETRTQIEEASFERRVLYLEIFLERVKQFKHIGKTSLNELS